jgi:hypothetical protein
MTCDQLDEVNQNSPTSFLPRWDAKTIEAAIGDDVGDPSYRQQTEVRNNMPMFLS